VEYVRAVEAPSAATSGLKVVASLESAWIVAVSIPPGLTGAPLHAHPADQLLYVLDGRVGVKLGPDDHEIGAGGFAFVPAGTPHEVSNASDGPALHLELTVPGIPPGRQPSTAATTREARPGSYVRMYEPGAGTEAMPGFAIQWLANRELGSEHCGLYVADTDAGSGGPGMHIHRFDQAYVVLDGELNVDVAGDHHVVGPRTLVLLPAGVPHRQWNAGPAPERHLALLLPPPPEDETLDYSVEFAVTSELGAS
jgi:quercetin dioxygenase-like cupin family protein